MSAKPIGLTFVALIAAAIVFAADPGAALVAIEAQGDAAGRTVAIDLAKELAAGRLRASGRTVAPLADRPGAVRVSEGPGPAVVWIEGIDFTGGSLELDVRGRDLFQQSFLGIAFHAANDTSYEVVYVRPFNFRATDPDRHQHAVQYAVLPEYDWPRLRKEFPEEFENPVDPSVEPADWVRLKVAVVGPRVRVHVGTGESPTLEVRQLGSLNGGMIGLWVGNGSNGDFANLRLTRQR